MFAEHSSGASTYWAAVVSSVPVLGLAMVIEARRVAARWTLSDHPVGRTLFSLRFLYQVSALVFTMAQGLQGLASGRSTESVSVVNNNLVAVTAIVLVTPLLDVFLRTNPDVLLFLSRVPPWSRWSRDRRRLRKSARRTLRGLPEAEAQHSFAVQKMKRALATFERRNEETLAKRARTVQTIEVARAQVAHLPEEFRQPVEGPAREAEALLETLDSQLAKGADQFALSTAQLQTAKDAMAALRKRGAALSEALRDWHAWSFDEQDRTRLETALAAAQREVRNQPS